MQVIPSSHVTYDILEECATLFSTQYGVWRISQKPVTIIPDRLRKDFLHSPTSGIALMPHVGHACFVIVQDLCWITQLVVRKEYRRKGYATSLIKAIATTYACSMFGIVSSNPYSLRALQKAIPGSTPQVCTMEMLKASGIPYLMDATDLSSTQVNTHFDIQHPTDQLPNGYEYILVVKKT